MELVWQSYTFSFTTPQRAHKWSSSSFTNTRLEIWLGKSLSYWAKASRGHPLWLSTESRLRVGTVKIWSCNLLLLGRKLFWAVSGREALGTLMGRDALGSSDVCVTEALSLLPLNTPVHSPCGVGHPRRRFSATCSMLSPLFLVCGAPIVSYLSSAFAQSLGSRILVQVRA